MIRKNRKNIRKRNTKKSLIYKTRVKILFEDFYPFVITKESDLQTFSHVLQVFDFMTAGLLFRNFCNFCNKEDI